MLQLIDIRARLLDAGRLLDDIALDKYVFVRDAYLTRRRSLVYDGDPPDIPEPKDEAPAEPQRRRLPSAKQTQCRRLRYSYCCRHSRHA